MPVVQFSKTTFDYEAPSIRFRAIPMESTHCLLLLSFHLNCLLVKYKIIN